MTDYSDCVLKLENESMLGLLERILNKRFLKDLNQEEKSDKLRSKVELYQGFIENTNLNGDDLKFFDAHLNLYRAAFFKVSKGYGENFVNFHLNQAHKLFSELDEYKKNELFIA